MNRATLWRALIVAAIVATAVIISITQPVRLGLDLRGGTQVVLEAQDTATVAVDDDVTGRTLEVLRRRVDALGVTEPSIQRSGDRRIIIELPGVDDPDEAVEVIGRTAQLAFHAVLGPGDPGDIVDEVADVAAGEEFVLADEDGQPVRLAPAAVVGDAVSDAVARVDPTVGWTTDVTFRDGGDWAQLTGEAACAPPGDPRRRVAIVLDNEVITSPQVAVEVGCNVGITGGTTVITGDYSEDEAKDLALLIRAGALPVPVEIVSQSTVGPTLGDAAVEAGIQAALIGAALTILFLLAYYRFLGAIAAVALAVYALIAMAALQGIGATLTLPGIAGFVLAIGMAVDGNVLVFERTKEEHAAGRPLQGSTREGFAKAWSAIVDSNATTLIAAAILYFFAAGGVRGFGITLSIGVLVSMFSSLVVTRVLMELAVRMKFFAARPPIWGLEVGAGLRRRIAERGFDVVSRRRNWFLAAGVASLLAIGGIAVQGVTYGLDFTGGRLIEYSAAGGVDLDQVRSDLADIGLPRAVVQETGQSNVSVRTRQLTEEEEAEVDATLAAAVGSAEHVRDEFVGPTIGDEIRQRALIALALALTAQLLYLAFRFRWTFGASAVVAMFHDIAIVVGVFAWMGKEYDGVFVAALLTVIGYSVNDSVVIFDRIREERLLRPKDSIDRVANDAALETLPRTINTGLSTLFILVALWVLGGDTLADFALALILGVIVGTYSSVFIAMPLATVLEGRWEGPPPAPSNPRSTRTSRPKRPAGSGASSRSRSAVPPGQRKKRR